ncbi:sarcosine oxidase subunit gamma [Falsiroseomonas sp. HW251]|uniref:sarcosine oxidase subunit gamma n=1 Tax=Falsiroseomonas sp. HW251 TaxID=3390998 RepID=UPI003D3142DA
MSGHEGVTIARVAAPLHQVSARRGVDLGLRPGRAAPFGDGLALCFALDTAIVVGARPDLPPERAAAVDQSGGLAMLRLAGPAAAEVLSRGCRLDLHPAAFPPGSVARTPIAQVAVILYRAEATTFDILVPATFAHSFEHFLLAAAAPFGCALLPAESP